MSYLDVLNVHLCTKNLLWALIIHQRVTKVLTMAEGPPRWIKAVDILERAQEYSVSTTKKTTNQML